MSTTREEGDDGALHDFWDLTPEQIAALEPLAGEPDPGAGQATEEP